MYGLEDHIRFFLVSASNIVSLGQGTDLCIDISQSLRVDVAVIFHLRHGLIVNIMKTPALS